MLMNTKLPLIDYYFKKKNIRSNNSNMNKYNIELNTLS